MYKFSNVLVLLIVLSGIRLPQLEQPAYGKSIRISEKKTTIDTTYEYSIKVIKKWEQYSATRYKLFGDEYIGYGHLLYKSDTLTFLSKLQADSLLRADFEKAIKSVENMANYHLPDNRKMVLAMFAFNCGIGKLKRSTLLKLVNKGEPYQVIKQEYFKYVYADTRYLPKMINRRIEEFKIW